MSDHHMVKLSLDCDLQLNSEGELPKVVWSQKEDWDTILPSIAPLLQKIQGDSVNK